MNRGKFLQTLAVGTAAAGLGWPRVLRAAEQRFDVTLS